MDYVKRKWHNVMKCVLKEIEIGLGKYILSFLSLPSLVYYLKICFLHTQSLGNI